MIEGLLELLLELVPAVFVAIAGAIGVAVDFVRTRRRRDAWSRLSAELGLVMETGRRSRRSPAMAGQVDGHPVRVRVAPMRLRRPRQPDEQHKRIRVGRTVFTVGFEGPGFPLVIRRRGHEARLRRKRRFRRPSPKEPAETDRLLDGKLVLRGAPETVLAAYLTPARRAALEEADTAYREVSHELVRAEVSLGVPGARDIARRLEAMVALASALQTTPGERARLAALVGSESPAVAAPTPRDELSRVPATPPPRAILASAPEPDAEPVSEPTLEPTLEPARESTPRTAVPPASDLDVERVASALFDERRPSFEVADLFERAHRGRRVRWRGRLLRAERFRSDLQLGAGPGTCAEVELLDLAPDSVVPREVRGRIALPEESLALLEERTGEHVEFEGTLASCDAFLRVLGLTGGRLVAAESCSEGANST